MPMASGFEGCLRAQRVLTYALCFRVLMGASGL